MPPNSMGENAAMHGVIVLPMRIWQSHARRTQVDSGTAVERMVFYGDLICRLASIVSAQMGVRGQWSDQLPGAVCRCRPGVRRHRARMPVDGRAAAGHGGNELLEHDLVRDDCDALGERFAGPEFEHHFHGALLHRAIGFWMGWLASTSAAILPLRIHGAPQAEWAAQDLR